MSKEILNSIDYIFRQLAMVSIIGNENIDPLARMRYNIEVIDKFKELHKQEIMDAFKEGVEIPYIEMKGDRTLFIKPVDTFLDAENYYNQRFGDELV
jgi:hypothetical protein